MKGGVVQQAPKLPTHVVAGIPPSSQASTAKSSTRTSKVTPRPSMKVPPLGFTTGAAPLNKPRDQSLKSVPPQSTLKGGRQCASSPAFKQGVPSSVDRSRIATRPPSNKSAGASSSRKPSHGPYGPPNSQPQVKSKGKPTVPAAGNPSSPSSRLRSVPPRLSQHTPKPPVQSPLPSPQSLAPPNKKTANKKTASQPTVPSTRSPQPHLSNVQKVVQLGFRTSRPGLQFFSYTGWEWEEVKGEGHTTFTAAYWLWKSSVRRHPQLLVECTIGGAAYILDWYNMLQFQIRKGGLTQRSLKWQDLSTGTFTLPPKPYFPHAPALPSPVIPNCLRVSLSDPWLQSVRSLFTSGIAKVCSSMTILEISRVVVSPEKRQQFQVAVDCLTEARGNANVVHCWHGSTLRNIGKIAQHGFGTFSHAANGRSYGDGVYLGAAVGLSNSYAIPDANGTRHMLLCQAALGNLETSTSIMTQPSSGSYDSGTDDTCAPRLYVVYSMNLSRVLPEAVITHKVS